MGGACCGNKEKNMNEKDADLSRSSKKGRKTKKETLNGDFGKDLPLFTVIKFQAIIRGYLARKRVKKVYGFVRTPGMLTRG